MPRHLFSWDVMMYRVSIEHGLVEVLYSKMSRVEESGTRLYLHCLRLLCFFSLFPVLPENVRIPLHSFYCIICHIPFLFAGPKKRCQSGLKKPGPECKAGILLQPPTLPFIDAGDLRGRWWLHTKLILAIRFLPT